MTRTATAVRRSVYLRYAGSPPDEVYDEGACRDLGERGERIFFGSGDWSAAKAICDQCPVKASCRAWAVPVVGLVGIWGGTSEAMRARLRRSLGYEPLPPGRRGVQ